MLNLFNKLSPLIHINFIEFIISKVGDLDILSSFKLMTNPTTILLFFHNF